MNVMSCASFDKTNLHRHISTLASDEFDGRAPLSQGEVVTLNYIEKELAQYKVVPLPGQTSLRQTVPLTHIKTQLIKPLSWGNVTLKSHDDIVITSESINTDINLKNAPIIFVGYGITAPEYNWDDYKNCDVKGKIVLTLVSDPGFVSPNLFNGKDSTYYGRWIYKLEEARRHGALGAIIIHEADEAGYGFHVVQQKNGIFILPDQQQILTIQAWLHKDAAQKIFADHKLNFDALKTKALNPGAANVALGSAYIQAHNTVTPGQSHNICGMIKGKTDSFVAVSAHWDHLGSKMSSSGKRSIYRGAIDNASGVAALFELARYFSLHQPTKNILFCSFTAEEQGLLGAQHFLQNPPIPLESVKGMLNFDCLNTGEKNQSVTFYGPENNDLFPLLKNQVERQNRVVVKDRNGSKGYFYRSDHYPFVKRNIPALLFMDLGLSNPDYLHSHYHQPSDAHDPSWSLDGLVQDLKLFADIIEKI